MRITSDPPGALVSLNGEEVARTPATVPLTWYGRYDVAARKDGYETTKVKKWVVAPWWQWPPIDLLAEVLPLRLRDQRELALELTPAVVVDEATTPALLERAADLRADLPATRASR